MSQQLRNAGRSLARSQAAQSPPLPPLPPLASTTVNRLIAECAESPRVEFVAIVPTNTVASFKTVLWFVCRALFLPFYLLYDDETNFWHELQDPQSKLQQTCSLLVCLALFIVVVTDIPYVGLGGNEATCETALVLFLLCIIVPWLVVCCVIVCCFIISAIWNAGLIYLPSRQHVRGDAFLGGIQEGRWVLYVRGVRTDWGRYNTCARKLPNCLGSSAISLCRWAMIISRVIVCAILCCSCSVGLVLIICASKHLFPVSTVHFTWIVFLQAMVLVSSNFVVEIIRNSKLNDRQTVRDVEKGFIECVGQLGRMFPSRFSRECSAAWNAFSAVNSQMQWRNLSWQFRHQSLL